MHKTIFSMAVAVIVAAGAQPGWAQPAGESWEISGTMQMQGTAMPMPPRKACLRPEDSTAAPMQNNCKTTATDVTGATKRFKVVCGPPEPMEGVGETTRSGDRMEGRYTLKSKQGEMTVVFSGRKLGPCVPGK